jgi:hypothetical protein
MELHEEMLQIKQAGMWKAAAIWEMLEHLPQPIGPTDIYKAASSIKCSEFLARTINHRLAPALVECVTQFFADTSDIVGEDGEIPEGLRALSFIEETMPMTDEIFSDAAACATRQHVYDGIMLLAAVKLGKEAETKKCIEDMQQGVAKILIMDYLKESLMNEVDKEAFRSILDPDKAQA